MRILEGKARIAIFSFNLYGAMVYKLTDRIIFSLLAYRIFRYHHGKTLITFVNDESILNLTSN